jgi:hypothetical protein
VNLWRRAAGVAGLSGVTASFAVVLFALPPPTPTAKCPAGEVLSERTNVCMPALPTEGLEPTMGPWGSQPEIDGVLCTGQNSYECIGLAEESEAAGPTPSPHASVSAGVSTTPTSIGVQESFTPQDTND